MRTNNSIDLHAVKTWSEESEIVTPHDGLPPYLRRKIIIQQHQVETTLTLYTTAKCPICEEPITRTTPYEKHIDIEDGSLRNEWAHQQCVQQYQKEMDSWIDRFAARETKKKV